MEDFAAPRVFVARTTRPAKFQGYFSYKVRQSARRFEGLRLLNSWRAGVEKGRCYRLQTDLQGGRPGHPGLKLGQRGEGAPRAPHRPSEGKDRSLRPGAGSAGIGGSPGPDRPSEGKARSPWCRGWAIVGEGQGGGLPGPRPTFKGEGQITLVQGLGHCGGGVRRGPPRAQTDLQGGRPGHPGAGAGRGA